MRLFMTMVIMVAMSVTLSGCLVIDTSFDVGGGFCDVDADCGAGEFCDDGICCPDDWYHPEESESGWGDSVFDDEGEPEHAGEQGEHCVLSLECGFDEICVNGACQERVATPECREDWHCEQGELCVEGSCVVDATAVDEEEHAAPSEPERGGVDCPGDGVAGERCGEQDRCVFNNECGPLGLCVDARCEFACDRDAHCASTELCVQGWCEEPIGGGGECVYNEDCGVDGLCNNGFCIAGCEADVECAAAEYCSFGRCMPDHRARPQCTASADCYEGESCVDAKCRLSCTCDADCGEMAACESGFCVPDHEKSPECTTGADCAAEAVCVDGYCVG